VLAIENLEVVYDDVLLALEGVSLELPEGGIVALLGANGAGKTTTLRACTGLLPMHRGTIRRGAISLDGQRIDRAGAADIVRAGVAQVMEGRRVFAELSVEENLRVGGYTSHRGLDGRLRRVFDLFPVLGERRGQAAGYLSGGEQQMLAIGRALMSEPRYLVLDEPSLGLAPRIIAQIRDLIVRLNDLPAAYAEACAAVERLRRTGGVLALPTLRAFESLTLFGHETASRLVRPEVRRFVEEDVGAGGLLTTTLLEYVAADLNATVAAERLYVHVNTVRYRLRKIAERTDCDLRRLSEVLDLLVAVHIARNAR
jgi:branched-chain amino acid transport system ATP-binding protein